ncbi:MAG TPA: SHOCT domain-containing protein [Burkholderiales bacterium]|nr:SHOCT domain-containing protein [Burkholderiales bacterium]
MWWSDTWSAYGPMPWMFFGPIMMLVFLAVCVAVVYLVMHGASRNPRAEQALGILKERFARGEIDQAEFEQRRRVLLG